MNLFRLFKSEVTGKPAYTEAEKRVIELQRVNAEPPASDALLPEAERLLTRFSVAEKQRFYEARKLSRLLPHQDIGFVTRISEKMAQLGKRTTKQYVHQVLSPADPNQLFASASTTYKQIWLALTELVEDCIRPDTPEEELVVRACREDGATKLELLRSVKLSAQRAAVIAEDSVKRSQRRAIVEAVLGFLAGQSVVVLNAGTRLDLITGGIERGFEERYAEPPEGRPPYYVLKDTSVTPHRFLIDHVEPEPLTVEDWLRDRASREDGIRVIGYDSRMLGALRGKQAVADVEVLGKLRRVYHVLPTYEHEARLQAD